MCSFAFLFAFACICLRAFSIHSVMLRIADDLHSCAFVLNILWSKLLVFSKLITKQQVRWDVHLHTHVIFQNSVQGIPISKHLMMIKCCWWYIDWGQNWCLFQTSKFIFNGKFATLLLFFSFLFYWNFIIAMYHLPQANRTYITHFNSLMPLHSFNFQFQLN